jgi:hypothetical protein
MPSAVRADEVAAPDASAPLVCTPSADPKQRIVGATQLIKEVSQLTAWSNPEKLDLAPVAALIEQLRTLAFRLECDKASTPSWPTQKDCDAMPTLCRGPVAQCRKDGEARSDCFQRVRDGDPRIAADRLAAKAREQADKLYKLVQAETACRASDKCLDHRAAAATCALVENRANLVRSIAEEKANPSGVVDLARLHELGEGVQYSDAKIQEAKTYFQALRKKPWREALCQ